MKRSNCHSKLFEITTNGQRS